VSNTYQKTGRRAQPDPQPREVTVPEQVVVSMTEIAEAAKEGLLALAAGTGLQVMAAMFDEDVTRLCGPAGRHNAERAGYRHGSENGPVTLGGRRLAVTRPRVRATARSASEGPGAETARRHEGGNSEIDQVDRDRCPLATAEAHDHRASKQQNRTRSGQRHQNRRDVERGGQDQARRAQELKNSDGLEGTGAEVSGPFPGSLGGGTGALQEPIEVLFGHEQLGAAAHQEDNGQQSGNDPQREVHAVSPLWRGSEGSRAFLGWQLVWQVLGRRWRRTGVARSAAW
jgi:hypothetical protein